MKEQYKPLFTPWKIGSCEIKNRFVHTSMGGTSLFGWMEPHHFDKEAANYFLERAKNEVGLILPGIAPIRNVICGTWIYQNKGMFKKIKTYMDEIHKTGSKLFVQLTAGFGRSFAVTPLMEKIYTNKFLRVVAKPFLDVERLCMSASPNPNRWSDKVPSREMTIKEIEKMVEGFAKTALLCKEAGVDGVEIHAVHEGYLLDQFTMKYTNQRTDSYGGSLEGRYKFPMDIVKAIKAKCGKDYPVSLRFSVVSKTKGFRQGALPGEKYNEVGRDLAEAEIAAKMLQDAGYDMLNCDNGTYDAWYWAHPPGYMPKSCNLPEVEHIKKFVTIPVVCAGKMEASTAAESIAKGKLDGMGVARQFLVDPEWITKLKEDRENEIKPCIQCHNGCFNMAHYEGTANDQELSDTAGMARCALNAQTMQTRKHYILPANKTKKVAVIGAGIGGMESALVLAKRGHQVTIFEKSDKLGGVFIAASTPSFKDSDRALLKWYEQELKHYDKIKIEFNKEIKTLEELKEFEDVIVATGAAANKPKSLPGVDKTIQAVDFLLGNKEVNGDVVIIGGGLTGCEIAYDLSLKGKKVSIVEMKQDLMAVQGLCLANSSYLREYFALNNVPVYLNTTVKEITDEGVVIVTKTGEEKVLPSKTVILSVGYHPTPVFEGKNVHIVGDASKVGNLKTVIWQAWDVCMKI